VQIAEDIRAEFSDHGYQISAAALFLGLVGRWRVCAHSLNRWSSEHDPPRCISFSDGTGLRPVVEWKSNIGHYIECDTTNATRAYDNQQRKEIQHGTRRLVDNASFRTDSDHSRLFNLLSSVRLRTWCRSVPNALGSFGLGKHLRTSSTLYEAVRKARTMGRGSPSGNSSCDTETSESVQAVNDLTSIGYPVCSKRAIAHRPEGSPTPCKVIFIGMESASRANTVSGRCPAGGHHRVEKGRRILAALIFEQVRGAVAARLIPEESCRAAVWRSLKGPRKANNRLVFVFLAT
jgi:hypothetical protein